MSFCRAIVASSLIVAAGAGRANAAVPSSWTAAHTSHFMGMSSATVRIIEHKLPPVVFEAVGHQLLGSVSVGSDGAVWAPGLTGVVRYVGGVFSGFPAPNTVDGKSLVSLEKPFIVGPDNVGYAVADYVDVHHSTSVYWLRIRANGSITPTLGCCNYVDGLSIGSDGRLYQGDDSGFVDQLTLPGLSLRSLVQLPDNGPCGYPVTSTAMTTGEDRSVWVAAASLGCGVPTVDFLYQISTVPKITARYRLPKNSQAGALLWGPDDALWFTEPVNNRIGRITANGALREFRIPTAASRPKGLTVGGDSALWFTESSGNKIGRLTTSGNITEYRIPTANSVADQIASGNAHTLWFVEPTTTYFNHSQLGEVKL